MKSFEQAMRDARDENSKSPDDKDPMTDEQVEASELDRWKHGEDPIGRLGGQHDGEKPECKTFEQAIDDTRAERGMAAADCSKQADGESAGGAGAL